MKTFSQFINEEDYMDFHKRQKKDYQGGWQTDAKKAELDDTEDRYVTSPNRIRDWKRIGGSEKPKPYSDHKDRYAKTKKRDQKGVVKFDKYAKYDEKKDKSLKGGDPGISRNIVKGRGGSKEDTREYPDQRIAPHGSKRAEARRKRLKTVGMLKRAAGNKTDTRYR